MIIWFPILGAIALATGTLLERLVLKKRKIEVKEYHVAHFLAIIIAMLPFIYFFWRIDGLALSTKNIFIFSLVVISSIIANLLVFYSMKWEKLSNLEPAKILEPLFIILLAILFSFIFSEELYSRNLKVIIPAIIAGLALIFSHIKRHHINFNKYFIAAVFGSLFFALELVISRLILDYYSPITFYFLRCSAIFLISIAIFRPQLKGIENKTKGLIMITGAIWVAYRIVIYYGYLNIGVIFTTLLIMLGPIFIYAFAHFFLKEKLSQRNIIASVIIVLCILYAIVG